MILFIYHSITLVLLPILVQIVSLLLLLLGTWSCR